MQCSIYHINEKKYPHTTPTIENINAFKNDEYIFIEFDSYDENFEYNYVVSKYKLSDDIKNWFEKIISYVHSILKKSKK